MRLITTLEHRITTQKPQIHHHKTLTFYKTPSKTPAKLQKITLLAGQKKYPQNKIKSTRPSADKVHHAAGTNPGSR
jgi:hypothetical protein